MDRSLNYGREIIARYLGRCAPLGKVLDLGAGQGDDLLAARSVDPRAELFAIEAFAPSVEILQQHRIAVSNLNIENQHLPFDDESIDIVMSNQVLEHVKEIFWILHEASRVLKTGGHMIIGVPNLASLHNRLLLMLGIQPSPIKNWSAHVRGYTKGDLLDTFSRCFPDGYRLVDFKGGNFYPFPRFIAMPLSKLFPSFSWGIFLLLRKQAGYSRQFLDFPQRMKLETNFFLGGTQSIEQSG